MFLMTSHILKFAISPKLQKSKYLGDETFYPQIKNIAQGL